MNTQVLEISTEQEKEELVAFYLAKEQKLKDQLNGVRSTLAKLLGNGSNHAEAAVEIGWKSIIADALRGQDQPLTLSQVVERIKKINPSAGNRDSLVKSVSSNLSVFSVDGIKNQLFVKSSKNGVNAYSLKK
jgi:hypothetical protein